MNDFVHVNVFKAILKNPEFAYYYFGKGLTRAVYLKCFGKKLRPTNYAGCSVNSITHANELLKQKIINCEPFMAGRFGSNELKLMTEGLLLKSGIIKQLNIGNLKSVCEHSGVFPLEKATIESFTEIMIKTLGNCNLLGVWYNLMEDYFAKNFMTNRILTHRNLFDFWLLKSPFTQALEGKKVLVVNPFAKSITKQYKKRKKIFNNYILPNFELKTYKSVQSIAGEKSEFSSWPEALYSMYNEIINIDFEVAILGCGAYGFPLAAMLKEHGKTTIHMGGVTQILFGIKGKRWDDDPVASKLYNEFWIRPDEDETPTNNSDVEGGCYW